MLGYTRNETTVLLFLVFSFIVGMGVWAYRQQWEPLPLISGNVNGGEGMINGQESEKEISPEEAQNSIQLISINKATQEQLELLPGIGPVSATRIIAYREQHEGFRTIDELMEVRGIGEKTLEKLKPYIELN